jgi:hypothetical protein
MRGRECNQLRMRKAVFSFFFSVSTMPQVEDKDARHRSGPDPKIQFPQLPKQLDGKYVRGQMYANQDSLPKQPVPPLEQTLKKYCKGIQVWRRVASYYVSDSPTETWTLV